MLNSVRLTTRIAPPPRRLRLRGRLAMSLMELLIVMGVLSTVVAISWPALRRPLNRSYAQTAAQQLQRDLLATRRAAMESGDIHWFQYQSETGAYYCGTQRQFDVAGSRDEPLDTASVGSEAESSEDAIDRRHELPAGTTFSSRSRVLSNSAIRSANRISAGSDSPSNAVRARGNESARARRKLDQDVERATAGWSRPLRFYPSGRMESGQISLTSQDGYDILVEIQGLAGRVKVHPLQRKDNEPDEQPAGDRRSSLEPRESKSSQSTGNVRRTRSD